MMLKINNNFKKGIGWSFATLTAFGLFSSLTFIPNQTFAESLIVDPNEHRSLSQIDTMQEMSQQICINSPENETKQLVDSRDSKKYWVTKLKDGNCWMTQNLDYDGGGASTSISSWTGSSNVFQGYHDPGNYIYNVGSSGQNGNCANATFANCSTQFSVINPNDTSTITQEKMHYHVGNYYSWLATMNGNTSATDNVQGICPANWKLPTSNNIDKGSFAYLLAQYGVQSSLTSSNYAIYSDPLYFIYAGYLDGGKLRNAGYDGNYWSSTPNTNGTSAYTLYFTSSVTSSQTRYRLGGYSVRCLAEGGGFPDPILDDNQANVSITVSPVISIDVTKHADDMTVDFTQVAKSSIIARVGSNQGYQVLISTEQSNLEQSPIVENQHIPMITTDQEISAGNKAWGISKDITVVSSTGTTISNPTIDTNTIYSPIGLGENKALFYTSNTPASEDLTFPVAIAVDSTLPSGKYSTQVMLTAVAM